MKRITFVQSIPFPLRFNCNGQKHYFLRFPVYFFSKIWNTLKVLQITVKENSNQCIIDVWTRRNLFQIFFVAALILIEGRQRSFRLKSIITKIISLMRQLKQNKTCSVILKINWIKFSAISKAERYKLQTILREKRWISID